MMEHTMPQHQADKPHNPSWKQMDQDMMMEQNARRLGGQSRNPAQNEEIKMEQNARTFFSCVCLMASMARSVNCLGQKNAVQVFRTPLAQGVSVQAVSQLIIALRVSRCLYLSFDCL